MRRDRSKAGERGQVLPLVVVLIALAAAVLVLLGQLGRAAIARARARTAADAAALAGAMDGEGAAASIAAANGAGLVSFERRGADVLVEVRWGAARARARARCERGFAPSSRLERRSPSSPSTVAGPAPPACLGPW